MKFSIITITWNRAHLIGQTIDSVLAQTYTNYELLIIDDNSTDNTEDLVKNYQSKEEKIKYIRPHFSEKKPLSTLRNIGLKKATGDIIVILDSDDLWLPDKLEILNTIYSNNQEVKFTFNNLQHFNDEIINEPFYNFPKDGPKNVVDDLLKEAILAFPTYSFKASLIDEIGCFDEAIEEGQHDYFLRVAVKYPFYLINKPLTLMRRHNQNYTANYDIIHCIDALTTFSKLYNNNKLSKKQYLDASSSMNYKVAKYYIKHNQKLKATPFVKEVQSQNPFFSKWYLKSKFLLEPTL